jgi:hypothetical protein
MINPTVGARVKLSELAWTVAIADFSFEGVEKDKLQARHSVC